MKKLVQSLFIFMLLAVSAVAQERTISGTVTDKGDGQPLPGVTVRIKGAQGGTQTSADGKFSLKLTSAATGLEFSYLGYVTQTVPATSSVINVSLVTDSKLLSEVVVTGMGVSREKKGLGYNVQTLKSDDLTKASNPSLAGSLQGKLSGVEIKPSSGMPGASSQITIRGARSFTGNNAPLYVIDGMPIASNADFSTGNSVTGADIANRSVDLDPNEIESMTVLKGQAASALYGIRASNGVILITTKSGKGLAKGKPVVSFNTNFAIDKISRKADLQNTWAQGTEGVFAPTTSMSWGPRVEDLPNDPAYGGNTQSKDNIYTTKGLHPGKYYVPQLESAGLDPWATPTKYDNRGDFFELGKTFSNSVNISQATDNGTFSIGLGNSHQTGIISSTAMDRYNAKVSAETNLNKAWKMGFTGNYIQSDIDKASSGNDALLGTVYSAPINYNLKGIPTHTPIDPYSQINYRSLTFNNPYWAMENNRFNERTNRFFGNGYTTFTPEVNWGRDSKFFVKYQLGVDSYSSNYQDIFEFGNTGKAGSIKNYGTTVANYNSLLTANYDVKLSDDFSLTALIGNEVNHENLKKYDETGLNFNYGGWKHIDNTKTKIATESKFQYRTVGFFSSINLAYKSLLYLNVTGRNDIVSSMPRGNRSFFYPSASLGFVVTELEGLKQNNTLNFLKLRASYAEVGQAGVYLNNYFKTPNYDGGFWQNPPVIYPVDGATAYTPYGTLYNKDLKPQNTVSKEVGFEARMLNNLISIDYTFSRQDVKDQIFPVPLAGSSGSVEILMNGGKIHTNAHEVALNINPIKKEDWNLNFGFNFTKIDNYVDELAPGVGSIFLGGFTTPQVRAGINDKFPVIYGGTFKRDANGRILVDENKETSPGEANANYGMPLSGEPGVIGSVSPKFLLGGNMALRYKRFSLSTTFEWKNGGSIYSGSNGLMNTYGMGKVTEDRTTPFIYPGVKADGSANDIVRGGASDSYAYENLYANVLGNIDEAFIYDASFVKMRELVFNYKIPQFHKVNLSVSAFARNILIWSKLPNFDPESSQGNTNMGGAFERFSVPQTSTFGMGLNLTF
ncbi:SusC/RagA family TonB-linked outer membrane protein [Pedobacter caeni]|uniref:TonB-linked outer membrane protein, SusC/RagA family n=1 Tax=Pedobacter caeni TaxID=288992 RepID=A0A1M5MR53_9SPHI|nr:SusC/RagA family TonB-linked outer membrane protein [Pedobacter caeni]SHG79263.1 TonB-linked outer membrane protein, SusC/RagA family [Pedobacter caeni]